MYVKADRLTRMGWKPVWSDKVSLLESLPDAVDAGIQDMGWTVTGLKAPTIARA